MADIESLIQQLQANNPNKRYDACEALRVMVLHQPLPQALQSEEYHCKPENYPCYCFLFWS